MERWFKDRLEKSSKHFLTHPIANGWNAERTKLGCVLADIMPTQGERLKRALLEILHERLEVLIEVGRKHLYADLVDPCGATVALDGLEGLLHQPVGDTPC
jgi:hypothetical protein